MGDPERRVREHDAGQAILLCWRFTNRAANQEISHMATKKQSLELTLEELEVLLPLASDQLFRNEFIDTRLPGFKRDSEKVQLAKAVISRTKERLRLAQQKTANGRQAKAGSSGA
jgi:hypothetical protein